MFPGHVDAYLGLAELLPLRTLFCATCRYEDTYPANNLLGEISFLPVSPCSERI